MRVPRHTRPTPAWELSSRQGPLWAGRRQAPPLAAAVRGLEVCEAAVGAESRAPQPACPGVYGAAPRHPAGPTPHPEHAQPPGNPVGSPAGAGLLKVWREGIGTSGSCWDAGLRQTIGDLEATASGRLYRWDPESDAWLLGSWPQRLRGLTRRQCVLGRLGGHLDAWDMIGLDT